MAPPSLGVEWHHHSIILGKPGDNPSDHARKDGQRVGLGHGQSGHGDSAVSRRAGMNLSEVGPCAIFWGNQVEGVPHSRTSGTIVLGK
jgi:hypothetical protein